MMRRRSGSDPHARWRKSWTPHHLDQRKEERELEYELEREREKGEREKEKIQV